MSSKRLSIDSHSSEDSASSLLCTRIHGLCTPPGSLKSTPASSVVGSSQHDGSKPSSRTSSSEFAPPVLDHSSTQNDKPISWATVEIDGVKFEYLKIASHLVPSGWSNDPHRFQIVPRKLLASTYFLQGPMLVALASDPDRGASRYMISNYSKLYFWIPDSDELLYVTEVYSLTRILRRLDEDGFGLQTKRLKPLSQHSPPDQRLYHSLWFWEVPEGWSQSTCDLQYIQDVILGCYEYGLPLSVPMLLTDKICGSSIFFLKSGEQYYLYYQISDELVHVDHPTNLHDILCELGTERWEGLKTTHVDVLPEYGGPNVVADDNVPKGWTNKNNKKVYCGEVFHEHGIYDSGILLSQDQIGNGTPLYLVEAHREKYYIWDPASDTISRIKRAEGLQDILNILKDPSRQLSLSAIEV